MIIAEWPPVQHENEESADIAPLVRPPRPLPRTGKEADRLSKFNKGTTTLGFVFQGGIILACDSRASQGSFIATQSVRKIIEINPYLLGTMAGGAADCLFWERFVARAARIHELREGRRMAVGHAARYLANILWQYRNSGLSCGTMIAGWDEGKDEAELYNVEDSGMKIKGDLFSVGSGSPYAYGVLDTFYRKDMTVEEAHELAIRAIFHAGHRDGASGGVVRVYHITPTGWKKLEEGISIGTTLYEKYKPTASSLFKK